MVFGDESLAAAGGVGDASEEEAPEDGEDARTLPYATGRRFRSWRWAVNCSSTCRHDTEDFEGPPSLLRLTKYFFQKKGGDPPAMAVPGGAARP